MKKLAIIAAVMLVAFTACKKEEEQQQEQPAQEQQHIVADFDVTVGYSANFSRPYSDGTYAQMDLIQDHLSVVVYSKSILASSLLWEWGDGESSYGMVEYIEWDYSGSGTYRECNTHTYSESGTYTITLTVSNGDGETDCKSKTVTIL